MGRVELEVPEEFRFSTELSIRVDDVNYGGHLGNDAVLSLVHEARIRYLESLGFSEKDIGGPGMILSEAVVDYQSEGRMGELLLVELEPIRIRAVGFDLFARLRRQASDEVVSLVRTEILAYDYDRESVSRLPESFKEALRSS